MVCECQNIIHLSSLYEVRNKIDSLNIRIRIMGHNKYTYHMHRKRKSHSAGPKQFNFKMD